MVLLTAYNLLLSQYSGSNDIVLGTPVVARNDPGLQSLVACLVTVMPVRTVIPDNTTFTELLD